MFRECFSLMNKPYILYSDDAQAFIADSKLTRSEDRYTRNEYEALSFGTTEEAIKWEETNCMVGECLTLFMRVF